MEKFLRSNDWQFRLLRTIVQGVIGVIIANLDIIFSILTINSTMKPVIVALVMAILSPIMAELGNNQKFKEE